ncbi:MAG: serine hydrolase domain-containing protein [Clostridiaceae bacterium]
MSFKELEAFMDYIAKWRIPGADCAVYYKNESVFRYSAGYADVKSKKPITPDNLYYLYSASKVITCAAALQLLEKGKFLLTDPVWEYLPEFKEMYVQKRMENGEIQLVKANNSITVRDLFTMSAGLTYNLVTPSIQAVMKKTDNKCPTREIIKAIANEPLMFEPGTHWNYSLCHDVLGGLIEVISGKVFSEYLEENIFEPLEMKDTGFYPDDKKVWRMAVQYRFDDVANIAAEIPLANEFRFGSGYESGGAGLISSVDDYIRFANALCNKGKSKNGERILSERTIDLMRTNHLDDTSLKDFNWIQMSGYGYGLGVRTMIDRAKGGSLSPIGEFGWGGAAGAYVMIDPDNQVSVFYAQHMLNNQEPYVHPRIRNIVYKCLEA